MSEALAHAQGKDIPGMQVYAVDVGTVDAKATRKRLDLTQDQMATVLGTSPSGYKKWDQGKRQPSGAARTLLQIIEKEPEAVLRALSADKSAEKVDVALHLTEGAGEEAFSPIVPSPSLD